MRLRESHPSGQGAANVREGVGGTGGKEEDWEAKVGREREARSKKQERALLLKTRSLDLSRGAS